MRPKQWKPRLLGPTDGGRGKSFPTSATGSHPLGRELHPLFLDYLSRLLRRRGYMRDTLATSACHPLLRDPESILDLIHRLPIDDHNTDAAPSHRLAEAPRVGQAARRGEYYPTESRGGSLAANIRADYHHLHHHFGGDTRVFRDICKIPLSGCDDDGHEDEHQQQRGTVLQLLAYVKRQANDYSVGKDEYGDSEYHRCIQDSVSLLLKNPAALILAFDADRISRAITYSGYTKRYQRQFHGLNLSWMM
ncbi:hypothetical protein FOZ63_011858, partial [Perkinsus olseni]